MGNDSNQRMGRTANQHHMVAWRSIMQEIHYGLPPREFVRPSGIVTQTICRDSGHLATELCREDPRGNRTRSEIFASHLVPTQSCQVHQQFTYCVHGYIAGHACPAYSVRTRVGLVRPVPINDPSANVRDRRYEIPRAVRDGIVCQYHTLDIDWGLNAGGWGWPHPVQTPPPSLGELDLPVGGAWPGGHGTQPAQPTQPFDPLIPMPTPIPVPGHQLPPISTPPPAENNFGDGGLWPTIPMPDNSDSGYDWWY